MTPRQRWAVGIAAGMVLAAGAGVLVARAGDDHRRRVRTAAGSTTTSTSSTSSSLPEVTTTVDLRPEPTTTTAAPAPAPAPSSTTTTAPPAPAVSGAGALLRPPSGAATTRRMAGEDCRSLADEGWTATCGFASVKGGGALVWMVEEQAVARRAVVWSAAGGSGNWKVVLEARDETGAKWSAVTVRALDVSGDGTDEIVFGYRAASGGALALDLVEGPAQVAVHRDLLAGVARVSPGQLDTWASSSPGSAQHDVIRWQDGAWRLVVRSTVASADVPPSQF